MVDSFLKFDESVFKYEFVEMTEYSVLFAKSRSNYIKSIEKYLQKAVEAKKLTFEINWNTNTMFVRTNKMTRDPYIIIKAQENHQIISKGVLLENCINLLEDGVFSEIIYINVLTRNPTVYENRRNRLSNPKVLKALEILSKTKITVGTKTVCVVGDHDGIDVVRNVVLKAFKNIHPAYEIKALMIKHKLSKDNIEGDWDRFLPKIKKGKEIKKPKIKTSK